MSQNTSAGQPNTPAPDTTAPAGAVAIIGIGCRFAGGADSAEKFWRLLVDEVDAISEIPAERAGYAAYYDPTRSKPGKIASNQGGFLKNVDKFDAGFFGVAPREAIFMDPQQRILLETAWEAVEDAGQLPEQLKHSRTGVFVGLWTSDYMENIFRATEDVNLYMTLGAGRYAASGRISFFFGLQGPSLTVDTQCSSSLVAVHLACQSLRLGESNLALAGGANLILGPSITIGYSRSNMLAPDGRCKFGDAAANGYVRSEGAGIVVLKRLSDALRDNDRIYAVIQGSAVNNDGRSSEQLVAPGVASQVALMRESFRAAGIQPVQVGYAEAHGTGTPIGDPVELETLGTVLSEGRPDGKPCRIGSVKTNIGHTEAAAGAAGLIKAALSIHKRAIPAGLHFKQPNPKIPWSELALEVNTQLTPWPADLLPPVASVNSFGITGTNANVVLVEAPRRGEPETGPEQSFLLPISAHTPQALRDLAASYIEFLNGEDAPALRDICYTAALRRTHHPARLAVAGSTPQELAENLSLFAAQDTAAAHVQKINPQPGVVFVFPGQGAQWLGMGRELIERSPVFRQALEACDQAIREFADWSLLEQIALDDSHPAYRLREISVIQPVLFALEIGFARLWQSWGVQPAAVLGHSMGEVAAAYIAGALSLRDAARVICNRSRLMQRTSGQGAMAVIGLPYDETETVLQGYENRLSIAVQNSPRSTVVAGDPDALRALMDALSAQEIFCRLIKVDVASHSPQMDPLAPELVASLAEIAPANSPIPFYSTVTQSAYDGSRLDAAYWGINLRQPVRFSDTVRRLLDDDCTIFIEMSPHPILMPAVDEIAREAGKPALRVASTRRDQPEMATMLAELGSLYAAGCDLDWGKVYPAGGSVVSLPAYPWQRERYWFEAAPSAQPVRPVTVGIKAPDATAPASKQVEPAVETAQQRGIREELMAAEPGRPRRQLFETFLRDQVAQILRLSAARIPADRPLKTLGMDSLMSVELRTRLETALEVTLAASLTYNYPTVAALVPFLAEKIGLPLDTTAQPVEPRSEPAAKGDLDDLDAQALEDLLADELSAVDKTLKGRGLDPDSRPK